MSTLLTTNDRRLVETLKDLRNRHGGDVTELQVIAMANAMHVREERLRWLLRRAGFAVKASGNMPRIIERPASTEDAQRCWDCGEYAPAGVCAGPHEDGSYIRGRSQSQVYSTEAREVSYGTTIEYNRQRAREGAA